MYFAGCLHEYNKRIAILCAYKPPSVDNATFSKELSTMLDEASNVI